MVISILLTIVSACFFAEFAGYFIHKLLHSEKVEFLSRNHMIHHLKIYGPKMHQRPVDHYINSTQGRAAVFNIGLEWLLPVGIVLGTLLTGFWLLKIPVVDRIIFLAVAIGWSVFMFSYVHDAIHVKDIWIEKNPLVRRRFMKARKLHDIHHMELSDDGRMTKNFGICFFFFDRLFGSLNQTAKPFNKAGFAAAQERYAYIYDAPGMK